MTTTCSTELLESALAGDLPPDREELLHRHLDECPSCSAALEQLAGGPAWCREAAALLTADELDAATPGYLRAGDEHWSDADFTVEHLEPSDQPGVLGRLGGYDVLEVIGRGGMGVVLKGFDPELKRLVAIKVLSPHLAASSLAKKRFAREAQAAAAVMHPNVLAIHQVQPGGRLPFLVMPLVAGESLAQRLVAEGRLELKEILRIGMQAAAGLAAAHEQGLVHRDVKPANILLEKGVERAVLTDFGLARAADDVSMTRWGVIAGTPQYMSPEQARGEPLDGRSDLFSLGCVLYEMATGVSPFRADSTLATLRRLIDDPPPALASLNPELPPWFVGIVERLLEKNPANRFASAKEVSELLEGCLAHVQQPANVPLPVLGTLRVPSAKSESDALLKSQHDGTRSVPNTGLDGTRSVPATKRWRPYLVVTAIGLLFFGGLALAVGILIHVKKGDKTTTLEVPEGSTARVDAQGAVTVELPSGKAASSAPPSGGDRKAGGGPMSAAQEPSFGMCTGSISDGRISTGPMTELKLSASTGASRSAGISAGTPAAPNAPRPGRLTPFDSPSIPEGIVLPAYCTLYDLTKELALSAEQLEKLQQVSWVYQIDMKKALETLPEHGDARLGWLEQARKSVRRKVEEVLTPDQVTRYKTLSFRRLVFGTLANPQVCKDLGLTAEQERAHVQIGIDARAKGERIHQETTNKALKLLTPNQLRRLKEEVKQDFDNAAFGSLVANPVVADRVNLTLEQIKALRELSNAQNKNWQDNLLDANDKLFKMLTPGQQQKLREIIEKADIGEPSETGKHALLYEVDPTAGPAPIPAADMDKLVHAIDRRLNSATEKVVAVRKLDGGRIEVTLLRGEADRQRVERLLSRRGTLEFRILADDRADKAVIEQARKDASKNEVLDATGKRLAWWVPAAPRDEKSPVGDDHSARRTVKQNNLEVTEILVLADEQNVTGAYVTEAKVTNDSLGQNAVWFALNAEGARRFGALTGENLPDPDKDLRRMLGIVVDGQLVSAPALMERITSRGQITGTFTQQEVDDLVDTLNAGALPVPVRPVQIKPAAAPSKPPVSTDSAAPRADERPGGARRLTPKEYQAARETMTAAHKRIGEVVRERTLKLDFDALPVASLAESPADA